MMTPNFNELMNLLADFISLPILFIIFFNKNLPRFRLFLIALVLIFASHVFTIAESYIFPNLLNYLEHIFLMISGVFFLAGIIKYFLKENTL